MMLLLKKKKYAALVVAEQPDGTVTYTKERKGLDMVRRDWCVWSKDLGYTVLDHILSGEERETIVGKIHLLLEAEAAAARAGELPLAKYVITRGLNKHPKDYPDANSQPHLQVALGMIAAGRAVNVGDHVPFVICTQTREEYEEAKKKANGGGGGADEADTSNPGGSPAPVKPPASKGSSSAAQRAFHPDTVAKAGDLLTVDVEWYLTQQILPPVGRLCEPIEGTSQARLAECLGLDTSRYSAHITGSTSNMGTWWTKHQPAVLYTAFTSTENAKTHFLHPRWLLIEWVACVVAFALLVCAADDDFVFTSTQEDTARFASAQRLRVGCLRCGIIEDFPGVVHQRTDGSHVSGLVCSTAGCDGGRARVVMEGESEVIIGSQWEGGSERLAPSDATLENSAATMACIMTQELRRLLRQYAMGYVC